MTDLIKKGKKVFTFTVVLTTIAWSIGLGALALPLAANALTSGDLIKGTGTAVYYYGADGKRYLFPNSGTYASWYSDWTGVQSITDAELVAIPLGGNVTVRPGQLAQFVSMDTPWHVMDPKVYAVEKGGVLRWVTTEAVAVAIFGSDWTSKIVAVPEVLSTNYTVGSNINAASDYDLAAQQAVASINEDKGLVGVGAGLTVALASDSPAAQTVPEKANSVVVAKFTFNAASAATLTDLVLHRVGVGAPSDIANVYLYDGSTRLTSGRSVGTTSNLVEFHSLSVALAAGTPKTLTVKVDIADVTTTGGVHAFEIQDASAVTAGTLSPSAAAWPVRASDFTVGSAAVSTVTVTKGTTPADPTVGEVGAEISSFKIAAGTNDVAVSQIVLLQAGSVSNTDITNLELWVGSEKIAEAASMTGDKMIFVMSEPYTIAAGVTKTFTVKATVGGRGGRTIRTYMEYASDVLAVDKTYGYGANVDITAFDGGAGEYIEVTTKGGAITVAFNGPVAANVSKGAQDVVFYDMSITSASANVEIRKLDIKVYGDGTGKLYEGTDRNLTDIKVKDQATGATLMGPKELAVAGGETATQTINFTDAFTLNAGETKRLIVTMDTRNTTDADFIDHWFKVELQAFGADYIKNVDTGEYVTDIVPNTANLGNAMTVKAAALTVSLAATPASATVVRRATNIESAGISFSAGSQSAIKVTSIKLTGYGDTDNGMASPTVGEFDDMVSSVTLWDGATQVGTAKAPGTDGTVNFTGLNWTIPAGETKKLIVKTNITSTCGDLGGGVDYAYVTIAAAGDVVAEDADANSVTPGGTYPINSAPTVSLTVDDVGTLSAAADPAMPASAIVVAGNSGVEVLKVKYAATIEDFTITKAEIKVDAAGDADSINYVKLSYKDAGGATVEKQGVLVGTVADFENLAVHVPKDGYATLTVKLDLNTIAGGADSGDTPKMSFDYDTAFEAVGADSGTTLTSVGSADIDGNEMVVRKTKPTISLHASSPSGSLVPGVTEVLRLNITADAAGDVYFDESGASAAWSGDNAADGTFDDGKIEFKVNQTGGNSDGNDVCSLYDASDDAKIDEITADFGITTELTFNFYADASTGRDLVVPAGETKTVYVKCDLDDFTTTGDVFRLDLEADTSGTLAAADNLRWSDNAVAATVPTEGLINGYLVKNLTVTGGTLVK